MRQLRLAGDLTQERLAEAAELHTTYVSQLERGLRNVSLQAIFRIAAGLGVPPSALMAVAEEHAASL